MRRFFGHHLTRCPFTLTSCVRFSIFVYNIFSDPQDFSNRVPSSSGWNASTNANANATADTKTNITRQTERNGRSPSTEQFCSERGAILHISSSLFFNSLFGFLVCFYYLFSTISVFCWHVHSFINRCSNRKRSARRQKSLSSFPLTVKSLIDKTLFQLIYNICNEFPSSNCY